MMLSDHLTFLQANSAWFVALVMAALAGAQLERLIGRHPRRTRPFGKRRPFRIAAPSAAPSKPTPFDAAGQLRCVERASFQARKLLNHGEARLFGVLERACASVAPDWRVMAQVSLGEILSSPDPEAYRAINSKRVDLLLVADDGHPVHAIELQGTGHHLGPAATRDAVKKEALRKAGVGYVEVLPGDTPTEIRALVAKLASRRQAVS